MSAGGDSWTSAGALSVGGSNTYTRTDTVAGATQPYWRAWWVYTPASSGALHLDTEGTDTSGLDPDTMLFVYTGASSPGTQVATDDDSGTGTLSSLDMLVTGGVTYHILVGTYNSSGDGVIHYNLNATFSTTTTVTLHAGTVADIGTTFGTGGGLTGSGAVWDDASDSTYLESKTPGVTQQAQAQAPLDTLTLPSGATVLNIRVNMRAQMLATSASPAHVGIIIWPASHLSPQIGLSVPSSDLTGWLLNTANQGTIVNLTDDIDATQYSNSFTSLAAIVTLLESGTAYITALARPITFPTRNNIQVRVYELSVDVTYTAPAVHTAIPPLQLVNRRDAFSSAPSLVNAGFHRQGGNRLTGPI